MSLTKDIYPDSICYISKHVSHLDKEKSHGKNRKWITDSLYQERRDMKNFVLKTYFAEANANYKNNRKK